ncbi:MAG: prepilin-type N-terminal cleavage/methylation domain-containing protein [Candidatus Staskawiczbacteria bacterium]|nr:prepilin-type N-terminal cleavage/methylation domain-containing protein [Candidatus Staskawiczbacteria bacterium]
MNFLIFNKFEKGVSLIEVVVCVAIFSVLSVSIYGLFTSIINGITYYRRETIVSSLANKYIEISRNLPYSEVGTKNGNPNGPLADSESPLNINFDGVNYQIYYVVNAIHDPADPNIGVQNYKQLKLYVKNMATGTTNSFETTIAPIDLASMGTGGVISIKVIDKTWLPVQNPTINITNTSIIPNINLQRTGSIDGIWNEIGLPVDSNYHIVVTKNGYSTDQTYSTSVYPNTSFPDITVIQSKVTQTTFIIDQLSNLTFHALNQTCQPISGVVLNIQGSKTISPGDPKFSKSFTSDSSGEISPVSTSSCSTSCGANSCCLEWDNYAPSLVGNTYMVYGTSPIQSANVLPNTSQNFNLILIDKTANSALIAVKDSSGNSIEGATVELINDCLSYNSVKYTGGSVWNQQDWSGGDNQDSFVIANQYYQDDGNINGDTVPLALRLAPGSAPYNNSGYLISSTFDTGTEETDYTALNWQATTENQVNDIKFQIATSNYTNGGDGTEESTWTFLGPDGTINTYYETSGTTISSANNNKRYVRYKVFLSTKKKKKTPMLSNVSINYVSGCPTPGQVMFFRL